MQESFNNSATVSTVKNLNVDIIKNTTIPLPLLHIQQEIVDQLETEQKMIEQQEFIKIFENKMKTRLDDLWQSSFT